MHQSSAVVAVIDIAVAFYISIRSLLGLLIDFRDSGLNHDGLSCHFNKKA